LWCTEKRSVNVVSYDVQFFLDDFGVKIIFIRLPLQEWMFATSVIRLAVSLQEKMANYLLANGREQSSGTSPI